MKDFRNQLFCKDVALGINF